MTTLVKLSGTHSLSADFRSKVWSCHIFCWSDLKALAYLIIWAGQCFKNNSFQKVSLIKAVLIGTMFLNKKILRIKFMAKNPIQFTLLLTLCPSSIIILFKLFKFTTGSKCFLSWTIRNYFMMILVIQNWKKYTCTCFWYIFCKFNFWMPQSLLWTLI